ncbi:hypothetical protein [Pseudoalteromonas arctica]|uniref:Uncharacterized protein n=1 Tax=Pseudoalteromonas arctica A 37-1-2 TaxID=1117313 RepID=A0A290RZE2_9GAMM|nr:hypothetical protein [Pseudoalteromonas arctica]ATC85229.1 hypothetical protein PARC_a0502 [Pseudoalteromonas arctica A 37-1-2]
MEDNRILVYLDHNVLDLMTKGDSHRVIELLKNNGFTPVYSDETLKEVQRSLGHESNFLELLEEIEAKYIEPILDQNFKQTGQANIHSVLPNDIYKRFLANQLENSDGDFGMSEMLMKFYGGQPDRSFEEIFQQGAANLQKYIKEAFEGIDEVSSDDTIDIEGIKKLIQDLPALMSSQTSRVAKELDERDGSPISEFQAKTGIRPVILKNVKPPNVVEKIWQMLSDTEGFSEIDIGTFFGVKPHSFEADSDRERTIQEKVNAVYHQLNFLGYYRDSKMKKDRRFRASFSDMTHAGVASFCHLFLCRDEDLVMKAAAAYEFLGVNTRILHYKSNKQI